ncbi:MAG: ferritin-like domain-containing protein [Bdellovibrionaceae bacterium]|nr:ferritin-like domain-containing protein [Pseudobdellovibrionaceae bacterium]
MNFEHIPNSMLAPNLASTDPLSLIMHKSAEIKQEKLFHTDEIYWNAEHYKLDHSHYFKALPPSIQQDILKSLNHKSLSLSYYIEKFGLNYGAKMVLGAESTEEKSLYALFSSDEVKHRMSLERFLQSDVIPNIDFHPMLRALDLCLNEGGKSSIIFTIQVVLEGFGLFHYGNLKESCQNEHLKNTFAAILKDEVLHHGMGVTLMQRMALDKETKKQVVEFTSVFVRALIQAEWVLHTLKEHSGGLTQEQEKKFKQDINWPQQIHLRIEKIKTLIAKVGFQGLVQELEEKNIFK